MRIFTLRRALRLPLLVVLLINLLYSPGASAQFCNATSLVNMGNLTGSFTTTLQSVNVPSGNRNYWTFTGYAGAVYTFSTCGATFDTYIRIYKGTDPATAPLIASKDDNGPICSGSKASIDWACDTTGTYSILVTKYSCLTTTADYPFEYKISALPCSGVPAATISGAGSGTNCGPTQKLLTLTGSSSNIGLSIQWQSSANGSLYTNIPGADSASYPTPVLTATRYYRAVLNCSISGQSATTAPVTINVAPFPSLNVSPLITTNCNPGTNTTLTATGANTYTWSVSGGTGSGNFRTYAPATTTIYQVTGTNTASGCSTTRWATIVVGPSIAPTASPTAVCTGTSTQLNAGISGAGATPGYRMSPITYAPIATPATGVTTLATNKTLVVPITAGNLGDGYWNDIAVPFTFQYYGTSSNAVQISTNGHVYMLGGSDADVISRSNPVGTYPNGSYDGRAFPLGSDPNMTHGGTIEYFTSGSAPNRRFVINYKDVAFDNNESGVGNVQMIIREGSNILEFHTGTTNNVNSPKTQGLISPDGNAAVTVPGRNGADVWEGYPDAVRFVPVAPLTITWTPAGTLNNAALANPTASNITANTTYNVTVTDPDLSCAKSGSVAVTVKANGTWTGASSTAFNSAANWCGGAPTASTNVIIPNAATLVNNPSINGPVNAANVTLQSGAILNINSIGTLNIHGDLSNAGTLNANGTMVLAGTAAQTIPGGLTINHLTIAGGSTKTVGGNLTVNGNLTFQSGVLNIGSNTLTLGSGSTVSGASANSYVRTSPLAGGVRWSVGNTAKTFPVGNTTYNPVTLSNAGTTDDFTVRVRDAVLTEGNNGPTINGNNTRAVTRTWYVSEQTTGGSNVTMTVRWNNGETNSPGFDYNHVYISHYSGGSWDNPYSDANQAPAAGGYPGTGPYTATRSGITSFSPFSVGSAGGPAPLPVTLTALAAENEGSRNRITWESATEHNVGAYVVERSADGLAFERMDDVTAYGKAGTYEAYDNTPANGFTYYRLKMVDADGSFAYSPVVKAFVSAQGELAVTAMPNPVRGVLTVQVYGATTGNVQLTDIAGRVVASSLLRNGTASITTGGLATGTYFLRFSNGAAAKTIQVTKQ